MIFPSHVSSLEGKYAVKHDIIYTVCIYIYIHRARETREIEREREKRKKCKLCKHAKCTKLSGKNTKIFPKQNQKPFFTKNMPAIFSQNKICLHKNCEATSEDPTAIAPTGELVRPSRTANWCKDFSGFLRGVFPESFKRTDA